MKKEQDKMAVADLSALIQNVTTLIQQGDLGRAEALATQIQGSMPNHPDICHLLGMIKGMQGQYRIGCDLINHAIKTNPLKATYFNNLGFLLHLDGQLEKALSACEQAIHINPILAEAHNTRSAILKNMGRLDEALAACEWAIQIRPDLAEAHNTRSVILKDMGRLDEALAACEQAIRIRPEFAEAHNTRSVILKDMGRLDQALAACERAIQIRPDLAEAYNNRGSLLYDMGYLEEALSSCERSIQINQAIAGAYYNRANILGNLGRYKESENSYRHALKLNPDDATAHSNLIFLLASLAQMPPEAMLVEQRLWDSKHGKEGRLKSFHPHSRETSKTQRIRVGYVSPDFRKHPVSYFFEPLLSAHDRTRFEIFCYASHEKSKSDETTARLRSMSENWHNVVDINDYELAKLIYEDKIDILVDLAGHTKNNRLKAFTYKPAPVQASYLGFFAASGLEAMDYWITDETIHPENTAEQAIESIYRLPRCSFCYQPPKDSPAISPRPDVGDQIVFGSFNHLSKLTPEVIETWSMILRKLPVSRLLIMDEYLIDIKSRERIHGEFSRHGIPKEQVMLRSRVPFKQYLSTYADIDIVLDTFPRTGGTTTAEALWNGVPVITLAGQRYVERISASKLEAVGLANLIADSLDNYVNKALMLARDFDLRANIRSNLRLNMENSTLCNGASLAQAMEDAYLSMWEAFQSKSH